MRQKKENNEQVQAIQFFFCKRRKKWWFLMTSHIPQETQKHYWGAMPRGNKLQMELSTNGFLCEGHWVFKLGILKMRSRDCNILILRQTTAEINMRWSCTKMIMWWQSNREFLASTLTLLSRIQRRREPKKTPIDKSVKHTLNHFGQKEKPKGKTTC